VTATLPELLYWRLPEIGLDFAMLYPSFGMRAMRHKDVEMRTSMCRAVNEYYADVFGPYRDRLEPVAVIPNFTPEEAVAELDHAVGALGLKLILMGGLVPRTERRGDGSTVTRLDGLGHGSAHDYDPVWAKCVELGVSPTFHSGAIGWGTRTSSNNYVANHLGSFANGQEGICRSLIMGGVPQRFPTLRFAFLEGGVTWACQLFSDLVGHYEKRNKEAVQAFVPHALDRDMVLLERGHVEADQFRAFTCDNAVRMVTANNPGFFQGTALEGLVGPAPATGRSHA
jgi:predicted TIM-barrel fold metal-dependent hydrolase